MHKTREQKFVANKPLALGYIGVGWIGKNRMEVLQSAGLGSPAVICEPSEENARLALECAPGARRCMAAEEVFADPYLDGIVIASPSALHASQAEKALAAGKAVFCQKPLGRSGGEVSQVLEAAKRSNRLLGVDLSYRYTAAFQSVYQLVRSGELGDIFAVNLTFQNAYGPDKPWFYDIRQSGGGCLMDLGIHLLDLALWTLDYPATEVLSSHFYLKGERLSQPPAAAEDFAAATLQMGGAVVNLQCSWHLSAGKEAEIEARFIGNRAAAVFRNVSGSFYDFVAEKHTGTQCERRVSPPDDWSGRAGLAWARRVRNGEGHDPEAAIQFLRATQVMDSIYGR